MITLLTDFGLTDPYVAQMKAVILSASSNAQIVDISHGIDKHNIAMGSYILETTVPFFPRGSIHVAVVDPGVGSSRLPVVVECDRGVLVGPDNGVLVRAADRLGFQAAYEIENVQFKRDLPSQTFHGRDIFALTAARIAEGHRPDESGAEIRRLVSLDFPEASSSKESISCIVLYVDSFGNIVTNIAKDKVRALHLRVGSTLRLKTRRTKSVALYVKSYSEIPKRRIGVLLGSQGYVELALNEASAADMLKLKPFDPVELSLN